MVSGVTDCHATEDGVHTVNCKSPHGDKIIRVAKSSTQSSPKSPVY